MDFSKLASLSIGLAAFLGGLWIVLQIVKSLRRNGSQSNKSGERSTDEWEGKMRDIARKANEEMMQDMRQLLISRNEELRRIIREEVGRK
jgi:hypothetical protein